MAAASTSPAAILPIRLIELAGGSVPLVFDAIAKTRAERSMLDFVELFWPVIEPMQRFVRGDVQVAIATHLEAITNGIIDKLLANVPPGFSKSSLAGVFWPAWEWGPKRRPDLRYISWSYSSKLTERDNMLCRKIVESPLYQRLWGQCAACRVRREGMPRCKACESDRRFRLDGDQNAKTRYRNDWGGWRFASSVGGAGTGERADRLIGDDLHSVAGSESDAERQEAVDWFAGTLPTRIRNADGSTRRLKLPDWVRRAHRKEDEDNDEGAVRSATVLIMQRTHLHDIPGLIIATPELGYVHLCIEMEFQGDAHPARAANDNAAARPPNPTGHVDARIAKLASIPPMLEGDDSWSAFCRTWVRIGVDIATLADPVRYPRHAVDKLKLQLLLKSGSNAVAAQLQQWPQEIGGAFFPTDKVKYLEAADLLPPLCGFKTRGYDLAATDDDAAAATVGVLMYIDVKQRVIIQDVDKIRGEPDEVDQMLLRNARRDGPAIRIGVPRDPAQAGKYQVNALVRLLKGYLLEHSPESGAKTTRWLPLSSQWKAGNVYIVRGAWNAEYVRIMSECPVGRFKDEPDASARAFDSQVRDFLEDPPAGGVLVEAGSADLLARERRPKESTDAINDVADEFAPAGGILIRRR